MTDDVRNYKGGENYNFVQITGSYLISVRYIVDKESYIFNIVASILYICALVWQCSIIFYRCLGFVTSSQCVTRRTWTR